MAEYDLELVIGLSIAGLIFLAGVVVIIALLAGDHHDER